MVFLLMGMTSEFQTNLEFFTNVNSAIIDPKAFDERSFVLVQADSVIVPPEFLRVGTLH